MSLILRQRIVMLTPAAPAGYSVVYALTNVTSSNTDTTVAIGGSYTTTLTAATDYNISSVTVTMGGIDITATAYSNGVVTIAEVTGAIVITAVGVHQYATWVRMRVKKGDPSATAGWVVRTSAIMSNSVSKMMVDGVEVTKNYKYDFGDSDWHTVYLLLNSSTDIPGHIFWLQSGCVQYIWIPDTYLTIGTSSFRQMGSASVLWNNTSTPTSIGGYAFLNFTANMYVPDGSLTAYKALSGWPTGKTNALSDYSGTIY